MSFNHAEHWITGATLSHAWANALIRCYETSGGVLSPAVVRFPAFGPENLVEVAAIRTLIDAQIADPRKYVPSQSVVDTVAGTIFPESVWLLSGKDRQLFFKKYMDILPRIKRTVSNRRGVYFQRMIAYPSLSEDAAPINQLEQVITTWKSGNHRHSALQAGIFDPRTDHINAPILGFPCLQQIAFHADGPNGIKGLSVVAFYATQTLEEKGYGNYLGLHRLGMFMAKEMGIEFKEVICMASALKLNNNRGKARCASLVKEIKNILQNT